MRHLPEIAAVQNPPSSGNAPTGGKDGQKAVGRAPSPLVYALHLQPPCKAIRTVPATISNAPLNRKAKFCSWNTNLP